jgi:serine/threonine protein kinase
MPILPGRRLGPYEILSPIGAGGMGEVYRARDARLDRDVALKVIPEAFAANADRMARFEREAKLLASLNHPHIASIYGLEESGSTNALVMELVEGPTLADRIVAGPIPLDEALPIAKQIAEALEYAHDHGVIHRDLKPANIKVKPDGTIKVLDFGLAKAMLDEPDAVDMSNSPTLSMAATMAGTILGTAAYMSPEQAKGKPVDRRADIWAFGVVFFEMLTGKQLYSGETPSETLAFVMTKEPSFDALPANTPRAIQNLLRRSLEKNVKRRIQHIGETRIIIEDVLSGSAVVEPVGATTAAHRQRPIAWIMLAAVLLLALAAVSFVHFREQPPKPQQSMHLSAEIGADGSLYTDYGASAILSPDGTRLALVVTGSDHSRRIYVRSFDQLQATPLSGTENARDPFFSPDGQWIGFFADSKLKKISVQGGAAVTLCDVQNDRGGSWGDDGTIVFSPNTTVPISKVSSAGGTPQPLTTLNRDADEAAQRFPQLLPGSKAVLFTSNSNSNNFEDAEIVVYSMASGQRKTVHRGGFYARYLPSGHIVYVHEGTLFAVPFDLQRLEVTGQPAPILEGVYTNPSFAGAQFSFSDSGNLSYVAGRAGDQNVSIYWMDREGKFTPLRETPAGYYNPAFSPDGKRLAMDILDGKRRDIWVYEWERDIMTRLTFAGESNSNPVWTPDGQRIVYSSQEKGGVSNLWWIRADGAGDAQRLAESKSPQFGNSWRPDGKLLTFRQTNPDTSGDIMTLSVEGNEKSGWKAGEPKPFVNSAFNEVEPAFSPDGRWLAYQSNECSNYEIYVRPFPGPGGKWQISTGGGQYPRWSRDGKELFYRTDDSMIMVVTYTATGGSFHAGRPQPWSPGQPIDRGAGNYSFDVHPDGRRFAVLKAPGTGQSAPMNKINLVLNWSDELKQKVPTGKN